MENQPMTAGRRWFRLGSVAQLNAPLDQGPAQAQTTPSQAQGSGQGPAPSSARPTQATAPPRIPLSGLPSERAPGPPQPLPQPPPQPQTQQAQANYVVNGTQASQQPAPPSPSPGTPAHPQPPPPSPRLGTPSQQPPSPPPQRSTSTARPLTPQPPGSPKPGSQTRPPTPTSGSPRTRIPSPPTESPKVIKTLTPPEPPINRRLQQTITAPPPHPEPEPNPGPTTTNHKTASPQQGSSNGSFKATVADDVNGKQQGNSNQSHAIRARSPPPPPSPRRGAVINNGEKKFIMMAGENVGAYMELGSPPIGQHISRKQHHGYILQHQDKGIEPESEREPTSKGKGREKMSVAEGKPKVAVVNSNVQSVNNSVISGSSCTQQSPGVHATIISRRQPNHKGATHQ